MKKFALASLAIIAMGIGLALANPGGLFGDFPILGGPSYCNSTQNAGAGGLGTGTCVSTIPAGPLDWTGAETMEVDTNLKPIGGQQSVKASPTAFGAGALFIQTTVGTTQTIPANTPYYILNGAQGSALTVTMPPAPNGGQIQRIICEASTVGTVTAAANTGQTMAPASSPAAACSAGVGYAWVYNQTAATWYRVQ